ncbi:hypothetical protein [Halocynthiibacter styelae]|uniref:Uncharacterized protein n=1 Tax=Halocynthiibacter styelae TaxID=2761955 RepID=A0A8J7LP27_9RHOB|nr:hypothetical protein [Paenihalocynthiibacter styelae]MBI1492971.1 hypothetical protein [Paenihalocynthiibacter styelae]
MFSAGKIAKLAGMASVAGLMSACIQGPGWDRALPLSDGTGTLVYDCRPLDGDAATNALQAVHRLMERTYYARVRAFDEESQRLYEAGNLTQEQIAERNAQIYQLKDQVARETAALGCEFKGILAPGSVAR